MTTRYTIIDGDTMALIASRFGICDWRALYEHRDNAELRASCPEPNLLVPGVTVVVPERPASRRLAVRTGAEHAVVVQRRVDWLRLRLVAPNGDSRAGWGYRLELEGEAAHEGTVPEDGLLELELPRPVARARLWLWPAEQDGPTEDDEGLDVIVGGLRPPDDAHGVQARLSNLGEYTDELDADLSSAPTRAALHAVGAADLDGTARTNALISRHGC